jgi:hypothetical protein
MYFVVALAQLTRRNGNFFRALLSLGIGFSSAVTLVPAIRMGQQVAAFLCFLSALTFAWNTWVFAYVAFREMQEGPRYWERGDDSKDPG